MDVTCDDCCSSSLFHGMTVLPAAVGTVSSVVAVHICITGEETKRSR